MSAIVETVKQCPECQTVYDDDHTGNESVVIYECGNCGEKFTRDESYNDNHQCPQCLKFASKLTDEGCPDCHVELEEVEMAWDEEAEEWISEDEAAERDEAEEVTEQILTLKVEVYAWEGRKTLPDLMDALEDMIKTIRANPEQFTWPTMAEGEMTDLVWHMTIEEEEREVES